MTGAPQELWQPSGPSAAVITLFGQVVANLVQRGPADLPEEGRTWVSTVTLPALGGRTVEG